MVKKKLQQVTNINNYGVNNGIIAKEVIISNAEVKPKPNYSISQLDISGNDSTFLTYTYKPGILQETRRAKMGFLIKPKVGVWYSIFAAYPLIEDSIVKGGLKQYPVDGGFETVGDTVIALNVSGKSVQARAFTSTYDRPVVPSNGFVFLCDEKPSFLFFGENGGVDQFVIHFLKP